MAKRSKRKPAASAPAEAAVAGDERRPWPPWIIGLGIVALAFWVYLPAIGGDWLWDDDWYITNQPLVRDLNGLGCHLVTIGFHAANALLVWRLLDKLGLRKAWLGGLIFAVHPAAVD